MGRLVMRRAVGLAALVALVAGVGWLTVTGGATAGAAPGAPRTDPTAAAPTLVDTTKPVVTTIVPTTKAVTTTKPPPAATAPPRVLPRPTSSVPKATTSAPPITFPTAPTDPPTLPLPAGITSNGEGHMARWPAALSVLGVAMFVAILGGHYWRSRPR
ncbi:MAG: hypothetical protein JWO37_1992 [Acidimicrobiales bacterium]|jgi:hypothetical protein|nr:hypothetical protein [Acidimicrobiales bacterium]